jgi:hypothetical protein
MALKVTFLVKLHNIPKSLMVNYNQTRVHPIPTSCSRVSEEKTAKHVHVVGIKDKQVTTLMSFATSQLMFLFQIIFNDKMERCLPPHNHGKSLCYLQDGIWHTRTTPRAPPNKQRFCDQHLRAISISTSGAISFAQQTKNGVVVWLLVSPQIQILFRLDELKH